MAGDSTTGLGSGQPPEEGGRTPPGSASGKGSGSGPGPGSDEDLIAAARQAARGPGGNSSVVDLADELPPANSFPGYVVLRELSRGGQGVVYQALQESTRRRVALKVMREGPFSSPKDRVRFEREVQILGQLNHPNIVSIHDSGNASGNYFFVMDYIPGQSLDGWVKESKRTPEEILALFIKICDGVNAAHLRGIIHRDLKPGNIRVDKSGEPHILDFGLAKVVAGSSHGADGKPELMTMTEQFVGTLLWASPEQAELNPDLIDTRTDVYSIGVMLYQALTGRFPYEVVGNMRDVLDNIMRAEPVRPSSIGSRLGDEVETIVLKTLSKQRERRYQTAGELALDLKRYLAGEPIDAKRDSGMYVLRKLMQRHRRMVVTVGILLAMAVAGTIVSFEFWRRSVESREREVTAKEWAIRNWNAIMAFVGIGDPDAAKGDGRVPMLAEVQRLEEYAASIRDTDPEGAAQLYRAVGRLYTRLRFDTKAPVALKQAHDLYYKLSKGNASEDLATAKLDLGRQAYWTGGYAAAQAMLTEALAMREDELGMTGEPIAEVKNWLAQAMKEQELQRPNARQYYDSALKVRGDIFAASPLSREAKEAFAESCNDAGMYFQAVADLDGSERLLRDAVKYRKELYGVQHTRTAISMSNLAMTLRDRGGVADLKEAEELITTALETREKLLDANHAETIVSRNHLGSILRAQGKVYEALEVFEDALKRRMTQPGTNGKPHPAVFASRNNLAMCLGDVGSIEAMQADSKAKERLERALELLTSVLDEDKSAENKSLAAGTQARIAWIHLIRGGPGDMARAVELTTWALVELKAPRDRADAMSVRGAARLGLAASKDELALAVADLRDAWKIYSGPGGLPETARKRVETELRLARALAESGEAQEAAVMFEHIRRVTDRLGWVLPPFRAELERLRVKLGK